MHLTLSDRPRIDTYPEPYARTALRTVLAFLLAIVLLFTMALPAVSPTSALADVQGTDYVGDNTVTGWGLTISEAPDIDCKFGILVDQYGNVLWSRNADSQSAMASITKMMTAVVAIENMPLDTVVTVDAAATTIGESSANLVAGQQITLQNLLYGLLTESGNDAAEAIAIAVGGDEATFVQMMNDKAAALGMTNTHYDNPHGLDSDTHYTTAYDLTILARYAMKIQAFRDIVGQYQPTVDMGNGPETLTNTNELLAWMTDCIGIKTGNTNNAGYCLCSCVSRNGIELYGVVLGSSAYDSRFITSLALMNWGYQHYVSVQLATAGTVIAYVPHTDWMDVTIAATVPTSVSAFVLDYNGPVSQKITVWDVTGNVKQGDAIGTITWTQDDKVVATSMLIAAESVNAPDIFQKIGIWFNRTFNHDNIQTVATVKVMQGAPTIQVPYEGYSIEAN